LEILNTKGLKKGTKEPVKLNINLSNSELIFDDMVKLIEEQALKKEQVDIVLAMLGISKVNA